MQKSLAIIPARGGSKRIPRKNIKNFSGQPIIKYSIDAAIGSGCFDEIMVSTDDPEIAEISIANGAKAPFFRSEKNSGDTIGTAPVLEEVILDYKKIGLEFDFVCCIYPTNPFITRERLGLAKALLLEKNADAVIAIMRAGHPIQKALKLEAGVVKMFWPEYYSVRSQDLEPSYHDSNQLYFLRTQSLLEQKTLYPRLMVAITVPDTEAQDINNEDDWKLAELKFNLLRGR